MEKSLHCALSCGAVYCNWSCLWVGVRCGLEIACIDPQQTGFVGSVLPGTSQSNLNKIQRVQNAVTRTVMATSKREHINPVLAELHWLPVAARIDFKIVTITFNLLTSERPSYLRELLQLRRPSQKPTQHSTTTHCIRTMEFCTRCPSCLECTPSYNHR